MSGYVSEELGRKGLSAVLVRGGGERLEPVAIDKPVQAWRDKVRCNDFRKNVRVRYDKINKNK